jgi:hypothetical protein
LKSEILSVSDLCGIHVGKSIEVLLPDYTNSGNEGILYDIMKDTAGYVLNLGGEKVAYEHNDAAVTKIRLYQ